MLPATAPTAPTPVVAAAANPRLRQERRVRGVVIPMLGSYLQESTIRTCWRAAGSVSERGFKFRAVQQSGYVCAMQSEESGGFGGSLRAIADSSNNFLLLVKV